MLSTRSAITRRSSPFNTRRANIRASHGHWESLSLPSLKVTSSRAARTSCEFGVSSTSLSQAQAGPPNALRSPPESSASTGGAQLKHLAPIRSSVMSSVGPPLPMGLVFPLLQSRGGRDSPAFSTIHEVPILRL